MSQAKSFSARIYASPEYREGYRTGCQAAHLQRPEESPYLLQDLRHLGWIDAFYDAWSARRVEINRAWVHREALEPKATNDAVAPSAARLTNPQR
jgi:hypothetical protein